MSVVISILTSVIVSSAPIMYASIGEVISQRSGVINLGLEGVMLMGAVSAYIVVCNTGSLLLAVITALAMGALLGLVYAVFTVSLRANQIVAGLAMVILGSGTSAFIGKGYSGIATSVSFSRVPIPILSQIPVVGPMLFRHNALVYVLYLILILSMLFLYKTRYGLVLRALGENPSALDAAGVNVFFLRYLYVTIGSAIVSLGGAYITLAFTPSWFEGITAGAGWIAVALVIFSSWNPLLAVLGALLFGGISVLGLRLQLVGVEVSSFLISMLPYISTVLVLILTTGKLGRKRSMGPAMLGKFYDKEAR